MSVDVTEIVSDVQQEFEGGKSLSIDWDSTVRRAMEIVLDNCSPETLKRRVPIYGGLAQEVYAYYCPTDVLVPDTIYSNEDTPRKFVYVPPKQYYKELSLDTFTIEYINGVRFLIIRHNVSASIISIDDMEAVGTKSGGSVAINQHNYIIGSASIKATFTDSGVTLSDTLSDTIDISDYLNGVVILPTHIPTADNLSTIVIRLKSSSGNYYQVSSAVDSIGDKFVDGWNMIKFEMAQSTTAGSPDAETIASWEIIGTTTTGETMDLTFDKFTIQKTNPYYFEYYSRNAYIDGSTNAYWQSTVSRSNDDKVNIDRDTRGILHYEMCLLVTQSSTFDNIDSQSTARFEGQLKRKYDQYYAKFPSSETPPSYSKSPKIDRSWDYDYGEITDEDDVDLT